MGLILFWILNINLVFAADQITYGEGLSVDNALCHYLLGGGERNFADFYHTSFKLKNSHPMGPERMREVRIVGSGWNVKHPVYQKLDGFDLGPSTVNYIRSYKMKRYEVRKFFSALAGVSNPAANDTIDSDVRNWIPPKYVVTSPDNLRANVRIVYQYDEVIVFFSLYDFDTLIENAKNQKPIDLSGMVDVMKPLLVDPPSIIDPN